MRHPVRNGQRQRGFAALRRRTLLNLLLLAAAAMLTALLWLDREEEAPPEPLTALSRDAITHVRVGYPGAPDVVLERADGGWRLTEPVASRAEGSEVVQILRLAEAEVRRQYPADQIEPAGAGLEQPPYTVVFTDDKGERVDIALGHAAPLGNARYARIGDTVYLIPEPNVRALDAEFSDLVAHDLLAGDAEIEEIELPGATLTRTATGGWTVAPEGADRGADATQKTVDAWRHARALWIKPDAEAQAGGASAKPEGRVRLRLTGGAVKELMVVTRKPQLVLRDPALGVDYHVAANQAGPLLDMEHGDQVKVNRP